MRLRMNKEGKPTMSDSGISFRRTNQVLGLYRVRGRLKVDASERLDNVWSHVRIDLDEKEAAALVEWFASQVREPG